MGTLILVRHSITAASAAGRNLGRRTDPPLADEGVALAARLGQALAAELTELPHDELRLLTSPAQRCLAGSSVSRVTLMLESCAAQARLFLKRWLRPAMSKSSRVYFIVVRSGRARPPSPVPRRR